MNLDIRPIPNARGYYATSCGKILSTRRKRGLVELKLSLNSGGYYIVTPQVGGRQTTRTVHQLVLEAFVGRPPGRVFCRHLDGNKLNNTIDNLAWGAPTDNTIDAIRLGELARGVEHWNAKLTDQSVREIRAAEGKRTVIGLSRQYGVSRAQIRSVFQRTAWAHVE